MSKNIDAIYISGAMKGMPNYNHFFKAESKLLKEGWAVFNPAMLPETGHIANIQYMDICLAMLRPCSDIYMLKNWKLSAGATLEHAFAKYYDIKIHYQE